MNFFKKHKKFSLWISAFIFVASVIIFKQLLTWIPEIISVIKMLLSILSPFIAGFIIAFLLYVPCKKLENLLLRIKKPKFINKHARGISVMAVYITFVALITVILVSIIPWLVKNFIRLYENRDIYYQTVVNFVNSKCDENGKLFGLINISSLIELVNPNRYLGDFNIEKLTSLASGVYKVGTVIVDIVLAVFSSIYMLISRKTLTSATAHFFTLFFKKPTISKIHGYLKKITDIFYTYIYSTIIDAIIIGVSCSIVFLIIGVDYAPLFGFAIGFANLIPYFGAIIAGIGVSIFTAVTDGFVKAIIVAIFILVIQQLDANILQPRILGKNLGIQPLLTLVAITVGGGLLGFWGVILGVPIAATLQMIMIDILNHNDRITINNSNEADDVKQDTPSHDNVSSDD